MPALPCNVITFLVNATLDHPTEGEVLAYFGHIFFVFCPGIITFISYKNLRKYVKTRIQYQSYSCR